MPLADKPHLVAVIGQYKVSVAGFTGIEHGQHAVEPVFRKAAVEWAGHGRTGASQFLNPHKQVGVKGEHSASLPPAPTPERVN